MKIILLGFLLANNLTIPNFAFGADLSKDIADLQKSASDDALREKIIKQVQSMKKKPDIPEEVNRRIVRGATLFKTATSVDDFKSAAGEFQEAVNIAPWFSDGYNNLALAQEGAQLFPEAIKNYKFYLLANPRGKDAKAIQNKIYAAEVKAEKLAKKTKDDDEKKHSVVGHWARQNDGVAAGTWTEDAIVIEPGASTDTKGTYKVQGNHVNFSNAYKVAEDLELTADGEFLEGYMTGPYTHTDGSPMHDFKRYKRQH